MVKVSLVLFAILLGCASAAGGTHSKVPCDGGDHADQLALTAHAAECRARVLECGKDLDCRKAVIDECDRWGDERCREAE